MNRELSRQGLHCSEFPDNFSLADLPIPSFICLVVTSHNVTIDSPNRTVNRILEKNMPDKGSIRVVHEPEYVAQFGDRIGNLSSEFKRTKPACHFPEQAAEIQLLQEVCGLTDQEACNRAAVSASLYRQAKCGYREIKGPVLQTIRNMFQSVLNKMALDAAKVEALTKDPDMQPFVQDAMALRDEAPEKFETVRQMMGGLRSYKEDKHRRRK